MEATMQRISAENLHQRMNSNERPVLINALSKEAYQSKRIPGSINITEDKIGCAENVIPDKDQDIVVYCANADCDASPNLAKELLDQGYENVWDFETGLKGWRTQGYELVGEDM